MPNWVMHNLKVNGPDHELDRFMDACFTAMSGALHFDFDKLIPVPAGVLSSERGCYDNWGSGSNACYTEISRLESGAIRLRFDTENTLPRPIYRELAKRFPDLTIEGDLLEDCYNFAGALRIHAGEVDLETWLLDPPDEPAP